MHNGVFLDELRSSAVWPFEQGPYLTTFTLQSRFELAMRRVLLHQATAMQSLRAMQDEINADIQAQRRTPGRREFFGSLLSWICAALSASVGISLWRLLRRKSRPANAGP